MVWNSGQTGVNSSQILTLKAWHKFCSVFPASCVLISAGLSLVVLLPCENGNIQIQCVLKIPL
jgi:hypothetical protein